MFGGATPLPPSSPSSIQAVYLKCDGAVSVVHRIADLKRLLSCGFEKASYYVN
jgi:hypothetical protein